MALALVAHISAMALQAHTALHASRLAGRIGPRGRFGGKKTMEAAVVARDMGLLRQLGNTSIGYICDRFRGESSTIVAVGLQNSESACFSPPTHRFAHAMTQSLGLAHEDLTP